MPLMKPRLYQYAACPFCSKVASILRYKGVDYETVEVHPLNKKEISFSTDYRAVPIYVDGAGRQVNDSTPIMRHIDREYPTPSVFRSNREEKHKEDRWLAWSEEFVQGLPTVLYRSLPASLESFDYITNVGRFSWLERRVIKISGALIMTAVAGKIRKRRSINDPDVFLRTKIDEWTASLEGKDFNGGDWPNGADLAVYGISRVVYGLRAGRPMRDDETYRRWMERMSKRTNLSSTVTS